MIIYCYIKIINKAEKFEKINKDLKFCVLGRKGDENKILGGFRRLFLFLSGNPATLSLLYLLKKFQSQTNPLKFNFLPLKKGDGAHIEILQ